MSYTPATLSELATLWRSRGGSYLGVVGSWSTHCGGYHLGRDRIFSACSCKPGGVCKPGRYGADYSIANYPTRDGAAATNAAMAIDLGPIAGHAGSEVALAHWLVDQCQKGAPGTADIRAVQALTWRWDRIRGQTSGTFIHDVNEAGHVHIEWFRDSEARGKTAAIRRWLDLNYPITRKVACSGGFLWPSADSAGPSIAALPAGTVVAILGSGIAGGSWSFSCNGTSRSGSSWDRVSALGHTGYVATGRLS